MEAFSQHYNNIRKQSLDLIAPLTIEDCLLQCAPFVSPSKWHLAHTTWFFEEVILSNQKKKYKYFDESYLHLFNSYYNSLGAQLPQDKRGLISRPSLAEVLEYRNFVDEKMNEFLLQDFSEEIKNRIFIGLQHEQQHQELLLMDIKYNLFQNPLRPAYQNHSLPQGQKTESKWETIQEDVYQIGIHSHQSFDNERPRHKVYIHESSLNSQLVTNDQYLEFIESKDYANPLLWSSEGLDFIKKNQIHAPLYWFKKDSQWFEYTLNGIQTLQLNVPVSHVSYYEALAFAKFSGLCLPREEQWEVLATNKAIEGNFFDNEIFHPYESSSNFFGNVWEWTQSSYLPYPGHKSFEGPLEEYNTKFMTNQMVLRGGSCLTPKSHIRSTYRNYYHPQDRWQCSGIRLSKDH